MAKKKAAKKKGGPGYHFNIRCAKNGLIVGAAGPAGKVKGFVANKSDIKLKKTPDGVKVVSIKFHTDDEFGSCTWIQVGTAWRCV